jgi:endonuclease/exonuclease/phosphatase family metal-dependent hydrolase
MHVMSFNILYGQARDEHAWARRREMVAGIVRFYRPDLAGLQEALRFQIDYLAEVLPEYSWIGVGREDGADEGEFSPIFYRSERLKLLDQGHFWLSETPASPSLGWDADCIRITTWGRFRDRLTGRVLFHFNTHFDHRGAQARVESARLVLARLDEIAGPAPAVVTGDLNDVPTSLTVRLLTGVDGQGRLRDARTLAGYHHGPDWTYHGFDDSPANPKRSCIDYVFVRPGTEVRRHGHLVDHWDGQYPSDHLPVLADFVFGPEDPATTTPQAQ